MSDHLISVPTILRPTTSQAQALANLKGQATELHLWLRRFLRLRGAGVHLSLVEALSLPALPSVADDRKLHIPDSALAELITLEAFDAFKGRWPALPTATIKAITCVNRGRLQQRKLQVARKLLPLLPLTTVLLDSAVPPLDDCRVLIAELAEPLICDLWALPSDLTTALLIEASMCTQESQKRVESAITALLSGRTDELQSLYRHAPEVIARQSTSTALTWNAQRPHRASHASLTTVTEPGGENVPVITWSIRIPAHYLPPASIDDTIGADIGVRHLVTLADGQSTWHVPRRAHVRQLPAPDPNSEAELLIHVQARRAVLATARSDLEAALARALTYRRVNLEELSYQGMRDHGHAPWAPEAMTLSGAALWPNWVELLAPLTGTQVRRVDPAGTSITCPKCAQPYKRPAPYDRIVCPVHGSIDADVVGAQMIRRV